MTAGSRIVRSGREACYRVVAAPRRPRGVPGEPLGAMTTSLFLRLDARDRALMVRWVIPPTAPRRSRWAWTAVTQLGGSGPAVLAAAVPWFQCCALHAASRLALATLVSPTSWSRSSSVPSSALDPRRRDCCPRSSASRTASRSRRAMRPRRCRSRWATGRCSPTWPCRCWWWPCSWDSRACGSACISRGTCWRDRAWPWDRRAGPAPQLSPPLTARLRPGSPAGAAARTR
jgi:hypothetical protein